MEPDKKRRERTIKFTKDLIAPDWQPSRDQVLWATRIVLVLAGLLGILTLIGLPFGITLWDWAQLLIVPAVLASVGIWFNRRQQARDQESTDRRAQAEALEAYLDDMTQLLTDEKRPLHQAIAGDRLSTVARARTLTVLSRLDGERKGSVLQFLYESDLVARRHVVVDLGGADLSGANPRMAKLSGAKLSLADLSGANLILADLSDADLSVAFLSGANLFGANFSMADLSHAQLDGADLSRTKLSGANLSGANLSGADLSEADLNGDDLSSNDLSGADLSKAGLVGADLSGADLSGADLSEADLRWADLSSANLNKAQGVTNARLEFLARDLSHATLPDGQTYEDWLKSKNRESDGQNSGAS